MGSADVTESQFTSDYAHGPPWVFKGRALYQLHLVKKEIACKLIPKELKLVEAFGYTLGGLFLAHYDASPAGVFDELVVISGIVWNPPTSCAWATRVLVSSHEACRHGRKEIGLPSHFAEFSKSTESLQRPRKKGRGALGLTKPGSAFSIPETRPGTQVIEFRDDAATPLCNITLPLGAREDKRWMGPVIKFSLPSFSGRTVHNPLLLKYSCHVKCRVRPVEPARLYAPGSGNRNDGEEGKSAQPAGDEASRSLGVSVLLSKPILALEFSSLEMRVGAPSVVGGPPAG
ncbi:unnamed protein product [Spirodela intermedia]|uniref:Uncharacterized protein n=1 Tax=Spirodela intermedia TaxID=51605 RepID=A0A7I8KTQ7_SPIIN|nr:unnamed protein product [Spirodela intermedia]